MNTHRDKNLFKVALLLALFIATVWYTAGYIYSYQSPLCEPDSLIYLQYARNMAEGHPFEYVQGDAPTTGCTSYLYPVLLAGLYKIGCTGQRLVTASFFLNGAFYLSFVLLIGLIARKLTPRFYPFALFAILLSGQSVYTFFGQTDMGLLMALFLFCFWAFLCEKRIWLLVGIILTGLAHPTAAALAGGLIATGGLYAFLASGTLRQKLAFKNTWPVWIGCAGAMAVTSTLVFNYLLTGEFMFMSLRAKGLFMMYAPLSAFTKTLIQFTDLLKGIFFNVGTNNYRPLFFFPLITGLTAMAGLLLRPWGDLKKVRFDIFVLLAVAAELVLLSTNNTQGISHDRYVAWVLPFLYIYIAVLMERLRDTRVLKQTAPVLAGALILFQLVSFLFFTGIYLLSCDRNAVKSRFAREVLNHTHPGDTIAFEGGAGQMWYLENRGILNPFGILDTDCAKGRHWLNYVETLKYHPELQSLYWMVSKTELKNDPAYGYFVGDLIVDNIDALNQRPSYALYRADWSAITPTPPTVPADWMFRDRLDIGYVQDEARCDYQPHTRLRAIKITPSVIQDKNTGFVEVGQLVLGHETFTLSNIIPNQPLHVVLRTGRKTRAFVSQYQTISFPTYEFSSPIQLTITIDGQPTEVSIEIKETGFSEVPFTLPAEMIQSETPEITVAGDHLSYGYWFYQ